MTVRNLYDPPKTGQVEDFDLTKFKMNWNSNGTCRRETETSYSFPNV